MKMMLSEWPVSDVRSLEAMEFLTINMTPKNLLSGDVF